MTQSIERFREQLVDYLYGELEGESLREFEASLRGSEQCRRELEAMKETLRISRASVAALRALDEAAPSRVSTAVMAAATEGARRLVAEPPAARSRTQQSASRVWSWLRTPWLLPTLGVAAAVSIVVLHKRVESPKMPGYESVSEDVRSRGDAPSAATERADDELGAPPLSDSYASAPPPPSGAAARSQSRLARQAEPATSSGPQREGAALDKSRVRAERKRDLAPQRAPSTSADRLRVAEQADESLAVPAEPAADDQGTPSKGYAVPPPAWPGRARDESAKKEASAARGASAPSSVREEREAAPEQDRAIGSLAAGGAAHGAGGGAAPAAKPASPARPAPSPPAPSKAAAPASAPADDVRPTVAAEPSTRAPDESVKRALEHMTARRFSQAAVAYRELLARYPKDPRAPEWRKQLTAAMQALSNVDAR